MPAESKNRSVECCAARYSNYVSVGHAAFELIFEFGEFYEGTMDPQLHTRIVMTPGYAKAFLSLFRESLQQYETAFGTLPEMDKHE
jgi:hypothetical protein